jgi:hypothetical protein
MSSAPGSRTALRQAIPEQAKALGISEDAVIKNVMLKGTVRRQIHHNRGCG